MGICFPALIRKMKSTKHLISRLAILACLIAATQAQADETIVILRHGEKPEQGLGQLSCKGLNRSLALPSVLIARYGTPKEIYAPNPSVKKVDKGGLFAYIRPLATIEPLAIVTGLPVNIDWGMADTLDLANHIASLHEGTLVVAWEHHYAEKLTKQLLTNLGGETVAVPPWDNADFDALYVIKVSNTKEGRKATFFRDREGLDGLSEICPK